MKFKLAAYAECPTCGGKGLVKGLIRSLVSCPKCVNGHIMVLVTREEMAKLLSGESTIDKSLEVKPLRTASGRPIPGRV